MKNEKANLVTDCPRFLDAMFPERSKSQGFCTKAVEAPLDRQREEI